MLNGIKKMIQEKTSFLEAASLIFEDTSGTNLDDLIVLGEESEQPEPEMDFSEDTDDYENNDPDPKQEEEEEDDKDDEDEDVSNMPIEDNKKNENQPEEPEEDILDSDINGDEDEKPLPVPGAEELPTPVGAQTGEPISGDDNILNVEIDLGSNTVKDVLPIPPANAGEAIADGDASQRVDSGFGDEEKPEVEPITPAVEDGENNEPEGIEQVPAEEKVNPMQNVLESFFGNNIGETYSEAITLGDEPAEEKKEEEPKEEPAAAEEPASAEPAAEEKPAEGESEVTSAVRDKVAEMESEAPVTDGSNADSKEDLLKKLGNITKSLEDAKKAVMNTLK